MNLRPTTALRRISAMKKKIRVIRGGQGSGKTISILIILINHAHSVPDREILIVSSELTKMRLTVIKDFVKVMKISGLFDERRFIAGTLYRCPNGSFIKFIGLDKEDVGKGLRSHVAYFNEVNKISAESYRQIATRTDKIYMDYNPDAAFFVDDDIIPREDCSFLQLTFKDNEMLSESEREEILNYYSLGYDIDGAIINEYWANLWQVYGLGNIGSIHGVVFSNWGTINELPKDSKLLYTGIDFGFAESKFACLNIYQLNGEYILDELVYKSGLTNPDAAFEMKQAGYINSLSYCDYAEPKSIEELKRNGIKARACESKTDIKPFAIRKLNEGKFYVTSHSSNLIDELRHYVFDSKTGQPKKSKKDHLMDALMYAVGSAGKYDGRY